MAEQAYPKLQSVLEAASKRVLAYRGRGIGEQNTKATLIDPVLEALGWDIRDWDEVHREFKAKPKDKPVDYALKLLRKPRLLIEAKGLGEDLSDRKWIIQILSYATANGVEWCLLTDGDEYRLYKASAPVDAEEKLFRSAKLSAGEVETAVSLLVPISRANLEENILDVLWDSWFVDRRVKEAIQGLLDSKDREFVRLISKRAPKLMLKEICESITRLDLRLNSLSQPATPRKPHAGKKGKKAQHGSSHIEHGIRLNDLISAGLLKAPLALFKSYGGQLFEATLLADGQIEFDGKKYDSPSMAGMVARMKITRKEINTNGWEFWRFSENGEEVKLNEIRARFESKRR